MRLKSLKLQNFKGLESFSVTMNGSHTRIYGDNATGKTTVADAYFWLLFGKDSLNSANFKIKRLDSAGDEAHNLEHAVEGVFVLDDGKEMTLKKVYSEVWTKRRGSIKKEFSKHSIDHFVDGVPLKKNEFDTVVSAVCPEDKAHLLSNPRYFNEVLHWTDRRRILLEVLGDISDHDVIDSNPDLAALPGILGERSIDDFKKIVRSKMPEINRELQKIPVRIDEINSGIDKEVRSPEEIENDLVSLKAKSDQISASIKDMETGGEVSVLTRELRDAESRLIAYRNKKAEGLQKLIEKSGAERRKLQSVVTDLREKIERGERRKSHLIIECDVAVRGASQLETEIVKIRDQWWTLDKEQMEYDVELVCPACRNPLKPEQVWEGETETGIKCHVFVHRVAVLDTLENERFFTELIEKAPPLCLVALDEVLKC